MSVYTHVACSGVLPGMQVEEERTMGETVDNFCLFFYIWISSFNIYEQTFAMKAEIDSMGEWSTARPVPISMRIEKCSISTIL